MRQSEYSLRTLIAAGLFTVLFLGSVISTRADDKKPDASGTWTWTSPGRNGGPERKNTLKLKVEGDKVTGTIGSVAGDQTAPEVEIKEAKLSGDDLSFTYFREFGSNKITQKFKGKVSGATIKGTVDVDFNGQSSSRDWEAKRKE